MDRPHPEAGPSGRDKEDDLHLRAGFPERSHQAPGVEAGQPYGNGFPGVL
jgi:hypothetical protein